MGILLQLLERTHHLLWGGLEVNGEATEELLLESEPARSETSRKYLIRFLVVRALVVLVFFADANSVLCPLRKGRKTSSNSVRHFLRVLHAVREPQSVYEVGVLQGEILDDERAWVLRQRDELLHRGALGEKD